MAIFHRTQDIEHDIGPEGRFVLRVTSPDVEIRAIDGGTARIRIEYELRAASDANADEAFERLQYAVSAGDGFLEISEPKRSSSSGIGALAGILGLSSDRVEARIVAELPRGVHLTFTGVSADVTVIGLRGVQDLKTVSGDVVLSDVGGSLSITGVSSDVSIRADEPVTLRAKTVSGDLSAFAPRLNDAHVTSVSGDIELEGDLGARVTHRFETVSGDLTLGVVGGVTLQVRGLSSDVDVSVAHRSEGSRDRRRYVIGDGAASVEFHSMSGDVSVHTARRVAAPPPPPRPPAPAAPPIAEDEQLAVLRALERGEIDVEEATRRLAGGSTDG
ncbi:MAG TPA: DUF4097 family beta strand repeat-containing protein [Candidatus Limnocylindria bacterium]|nr:DUF4097 family beta strand repeat-containing protein [Candidatus Limnocylindria bacterium]